MRKRILPLLVLIGSFLFLVAPASAQFNNGNFGLKEFAGAANYTGPASGGATGLNVYELIALGVEIFLSILEFLFFGLMVYAGIRWMTARGSEEYITKAKDIMQAAVIGFILVLAAYALTAFIFNKLNTGSATSGSTTPATPVRCSNTGLTDPCTNKNVNDGCSLFSTGGAGTCIQNAGQSSCQCMPTSSLPPASTNNACSQAHGVCEDAVTCQSPPNQASTDQAAINACGANQVCCVPQSSP